VLLYCTKHGTPSIMPKLSALMFGHNIMSVVYENECNYKTSCAEMQNRQEIRLNAGVQPSVYYIQQRFKNSNLGKAYCIISG
jgi:hypothetical protein